MLQEPKSQSFQWPSLPCASQHTRKEKMCVCVCISIYIYIHSQKSSEKPVKKSVTSKVSSSFLPFSHGSLGLNLWSFRYAFKMFSTLRSRCWIGGLRKPKYPHEEIIDIISLGSWISYDMSKRHARCPSVLVLHRPVSP